MPRMFPTQLVVVSYPEIFEPNAGRTRMNQRHNKAVKAALVRCLDYHQKYNVPKHFTYGASSKYKYKKRSDRTKLIKSRRGIRYLDLVLSGRSKKQFTKTKGITRVGGKTYGDGGQVTVTRTISWPKKPGGGNYADNPKAKPGAIRKKDMRDEIERWTTGEQAQMGKLMVRFYVEEMKKFFSAGQRVHKKFDSKLKSQGIT